MYIKKSIISFLVIVAGIFLVRNYFKKPTNYGSVIILNGPSVSGKSSLQKAFQKIMLPTFWAKMGIDNLFDNPMPDVTLDDLEHWQTPNSIRWVTNSKDAQGNNIMALHVGNEGQKIAYGMNSAIAAYAKQGCNVIVDYIAYQPEWLNDLQGKLADIKTYYVAVKIPLAVLEEREKARGTSPVGHSRSHYDTVYGSIKYDLKLESGKYKPEELAQQLKAFIETQ